MTLNNFNLYSEKIFDYIMRLLIGKVVVGWLLRYEGIDIRDSTKFGSRDDVLG